MAIEAAGTDLVTGAFSYSGGRIAELLLARDRRVRTLTNHPDRPHPLQGRVLAIPYRFDDSRALAHSLEGVTTLYNTYWVRFERGPTTFAGAVANSRALFGAARRAGVARIVHVSVTHASIDSPLPYYRGKALVEQALAASGVPHTIVRPTWFLGGGRDLLVNNIAWILRHMPIFPIPGDGRYLVQPVHVDDFARICVEAASDVDDVTKDAAGPETLSFEQVVRAIRDAVRSHAAIVHVPPGLMAALSSAFGLVVRDVVLTDYEMRGLMAGNLVSSQPALGTTSFMEWLRESGPALGRTCINELAHHFHGAP